MFSAVSSRNSLGNFFLHSPSSMQTLLGFCTPQGPCIIHDLTKLYSSNSSSGSGISAEMRRSMSSRVRSLSSPRRMMSMWQCGKPLFWNSMTWMRATGTPKMWRSLMSLRISFRVGCHLQNANVGANGIPLTPSQDDPQHALHL